MTEIQATKEMCYFCFDTILSKFTKEEPKGYEFKKGVKCPLFVTWKIKKKEDYHLRGCIGTFQDMELKEGLESFAQKSAFSDWRFHPIEEKEIESLNCSVSLLVNFEQAKNCLDWEVGKHGIRIKFKGYSGTYLPEVATEQGWDKETSLRHLVQKAGYHGSFDNELMESIQLTRYQSSKIHSTYDEFLNWKKSRK
ncbi:ammecr1 [Anaeramoeba ignava]|uniref:Ammecr1 n=1 Tax=Anaeramoeba ignava TaxID=1746090 RepID=A0A9Q0LJ33_ANAIG|nr:ammecr1 [Anaeramoeba ignava]